MSITRKISANILESMLQSSSIGFFEILGCSSIIMGMLSPAGKERKNDILTSFKTKIGIRELIYKKNGVFTHSAFAKYAIIPNTVDNY